jgi:hypothetical protein
VLTNKRLRLADADGNQSVPHSRVSLADDPDGLDGVATDGATPLRVGNNVVLVNAADVEAFDREYCRAALDSAVIESRQDEEYELTETESEVLMALHSGVSPSRCPGSSAPTSRRSRRSTTASSNSMSSRSSANGRRSR